MLESKDEKTAKPRLSHIRFDAPLTRPNTFCSAEGVVDEKERPWDEGLTPQERADAKRRYKNRKGVERWRRRKQVRPFFYDQ